MDLKLTINLRWLLSPRVIEESINRLNRKVSMITVCVKSNKESDQLVFKRIRLEGKKLRVERYINSRPDTIYKR